jgi:hypothetical protein
MVAKVGATGQRGIRLFSSFADAVRLFLPPDVPAEIPNLDSDVEKGES